MIQLNAMTKIGGVIIGLMQDIVQGCMKHGWETTAKNLAICVAMVEVSYLIENYRTIL